ncbi:MAG: hypothetical protein JWN35_3676 [Frankiales bacterium]|jgi:hypothetical protein|nr:hypothetical protein [Frankiales bacterium]
MTAFRSAYNGDAQRVTGPEHRHHDPDPDPIETPGLEPGGGVPPGETPPEADQISGAVEDHRPPPVEPVAASRTPIVVTLTLIGIVVILVAGMIVAIIAHF